MSDERGDDLRDVGARLRTLVLGRVHEHHASISSTSDRASRWLREGAPHGALVTADAQTAGRGRLGRPWSSPAGGGVYASLILRPPPPQAPIGALGLAIGAALRAGLTGLPGLAGVGIELKWPNDLLVAQRKLGGILCETRWQDGHPETVVGFGLNVARCAFTDDLEETATSLASSLESSDLPSRVDVLVAVLAALEPLLERFWRGGFAAIRGEYEPYCVTLGRQVTVPITRPDGTRGRAQVLAVDLDEDGALRARSLTGGPTFRIESADLGEP